MLTFEIGSYTGATGIRDRDELGNACVMFQADNLPAKVVVNIRNVSMKGQVIRARPLERFSLSYEKVREIAPGLTLPLTVTLNHVPETGDLRVLETLQVSCSGGFVLDVPLIALFKPRPKLVFPPLINLGPLASERVVHHNVLFKLPGAVQHQIYRVEAKSSSACSILLENPSYLSFSSEVKELELPLRIDTSEIALGSHCVVLCLWLIDETITEDTKFDMEPTHVLSVMFDIVRHSVVLEWQDKGTNDVLQSFGATGLREFEFNDTEDTSIDFGTLFFSQTVEYLMHIFNNGPTPVKFSLDTGIEDSLVTFYPSNGFLAPNERIPLRAVVKINDPHARSGVTLASTLSTSLLASTEVSQSIELEVDHLLNYRDNDPHKKSSNQLNNVPIHIEAPDHIVHRSTIYKAVTRCLPLQAGVSRGHIDFGTVELGKPKRSYFTITNTSHLLPFVFECPKNPSIFFSPVSCLLSPQESMEVEVIMEPVQVGPQHHLCEISILSVVPNDAAALSSAESTAPRLLSDGTKQLSTSAVIRNGKLSGIEAPTNKLSHSFLPKNAIIERSKRQLMTVPVAVTGYGIQNSENSSALIPLDNYGRRPFTTSSRIGSVVDPSATRVRVPGTSFSSSTVLGSTNNGTSSDDGGNAAIEALKSSTYRKMDNSVVLGSSTALQDSESTGDSKHLGASLTGSVDLNSSVISLSKMKTDESVGSSDMQAAHGNPATQGRTLNSKGRIDDSLNGEDNFPISAILTAAGPVYSSRLSPNDIISDATDLTKYTSKTASSYSGAINPALSRTNRGSIRGGSMMSSTGLLDSVQAKDTAVVAAGKDTEKEKKKKERFTDVSSQFLEQSKKIRAASAERARSARNRLPPSRSDTADSADLGLGMEEELVSTAVLKSTLTSFSRSKSAEKRSTRRQPLHPGTDDERFLDLNGEFAAAPDASHVFPADGDIRVVRNERDSLSGADKLKVDRKALENEPLWMAVAPVNPVTRESGYKLKNSLSGGFVLRPDHRGRLPFEVANKKGDLGAGGVVKFFPTNTRSVVEEQAVSRALSPDTLKLIRVSPAKLDFGISDSTTKVSKYLRLFNGSTDTIMLRVSLPFDLSSVFSGSRGLQQVVPSGKQAVVELQLCSNAPISVLGHLDIQVNNRRMKLPFQGTQQPLGMDIFAEEHPESSQLEDMPASLVIGGDSHPVGVDGDSESESERRRKRMRLLHSSNEPQSVDSSGADGLSDFSRPSLQFEFGVDTEVSTVSRAIEIFNPSETAYLDFAVTIEPPVARTVFTVLPATTVIPPLSYSTLHLSFSPTAGMLDVRAEAVFLARGGHPQLPPRLRLHGRIPPCSVECSPQSLEFGDVGVGTAVSRQVVITNTGQSCAVLSLRPQCIPPFVTPSVARVVIPRGSSHTVTFTLLADIPYQLDAASTTDSEGVNRDHSSVSHVVKYSVRGCPDLVLPVRAIVSQPTVVVLERQVAFGSVPYGHTVGRPVTLVNSSETACDVVLDVEDFVPHATGSQTRCRTDEFFLKPRRRTVDEVVGAYRHSLSNADLQSYVKAQEEAEAADPEGRDANALTRRRLVRVAHHVMKDLLSARGTISNFTRSVVQESLDFEYKELIDGLKQATQGLQEDLFLSGTPSSGMFLNMEDSDQLNYSNALVETNNKTSTSIAAPSLNGVSYELNDDYSPQKDTDINQWERNLSLSDSTGGLRTGALPPHLTLHIQPHQVLSLELYYCPSVDKRPPTRRADTRRSSDQNSTPFSYPLPITVVGSDPSLHMLPHVTGCARAPYIELEHVYLDFGSVPYAPLAPLTSQSLNTLVHPSKFLRPRVHQQRLRLKNNADVALSWSFDMESLQKVFLKSKQLRQQRISDSFPGSDQEPMDNEQVPFSISPSEGILDIGETATLDVTFSPQCIGLHTAVIPLKVPHLTFAGDTGASQLSSLVEQLSSSPDDPQDVCHYNSELTLRGEALPPGVFFDHLNVKLPAVPLGVIARATVRVFTFGPHAISLTHSFSPSMESSELLRIPLRVSYPEGNTLSASRTSIPVVIELFSPSVPWSFRTDIFFADGYRTYRLSVSGYTGNSLLTVGDYVDSCASALFMELQNNGNSTLTVAVGGEAKFPPFVTPSQTNASASILHYGNNSNLKSLMQSEFGVPRPSTPSNAIITQQSFYRSTIARQNAINETRPASAGQPNGYKKGLGGRGILIPLPKNLQEFSPQFLKDATSPPLYISNPFPVASATHLLANFEIFDWNVLTGSVSAPPGGFISVPIISSLNVLHGPTAMLEDPSTPSPPLYLFSGNTIGPDGKAVDPMTRSRSELVNEFYPQQFHTPDSRAICSLLNALLLEQSISSFPADLLEENGRNFYHSCERLLGRRIPGILRSNAGSFASPQARVAALTHQARCFIDFLTSLGGFTHSIEPEHLLPYDAFVLTLRNFSGSSVDISDARRHLIALDVPAGKDQAPAAASRPPVKRLEERRAAFVGARAEFEALSTSAWYQLCVQALRCAILNKVTPRSMLATPSMLPSEEAVAKWEELCAQETAILREVADIRAADAAAGGVGRGLVRASAPSDSKTGEHGILASNDAEFAKRSQSRSQLRSTTSAALMQDRQPSAFSVSASISQPNKRNGSAGSAFSGTGTYSSGVTLSKATLEAASIKNRGRITTLRPPSSRSRGGVLVPGATAGGLSPGVTLKSIRGEQNASSSMTSALVKGGSFRSKGLAMPASLQQSMAGTAPEVVYDADGTPLDFPSSNNVILHVNPQSQRLAEARRRRRDALRSISQLNQTYGSPASTAVTARPDGLVLDLVGDAIGPLSGPTAMAEASLLLHPSSPPSKPSSSISPRGKVSGISPRHADLKGKGKNQIPLTLTAEIGSSTLDPATVDPNTSLSEGLPQRISRTHSPGYKQTLAPSNSGVSMTQSQFLQLQHSPELVEQWKHASAGGKGSAGRARNARNRSVSPSSTLGATTLDLLSVPSGAFAMMKHTPREGVVVNNLWARLQGLIPGESQQDDLANAIRDPKGLPLELLSRVRTLEREMAAFLAPDESIVGSNVHASSEALLLRWCAHHYNRVASVDRVFLDFFADFQDGTALIFLLLSHFPELAASGGPLAPRNKRSRSNSIVTVMALLHDNPGSSQAKNTSNGESFHSTEGIIGDTHSRALNTSNNNGGSNEVGSNSNEVNGNLVIPFYLLPSTPRERLTNFKVFNECLEHLGLACPIPAETLAGFAEIFENEQDLDKGSELAPNGHVSVAAASATAGSIAASTASSAIEIVRRGAVPAFHRHVTNTKRSDASGVGHSTHLGGGLALSVLQQNAGTTNTTVGANLTGTTGSQKYGTYSTSGNNINLKETKKGVSSDYHNLRVRLGMPQLFVPSVDSVPFNAFPGTVTVPLAFGDAQLNDNNGDQKYTGRFGELKVVNRASRAEMVLLVLYLWLHLPPRAPRDLINFRCIPHREVTKVILISNPTKLAIRYKVQFEGAACFYSPDDLFQFTLPPLSRFTYVVACMPGTSNTSEHGKVIFESESSGKTPPATLVFALRSLVLDRSPSTDFIKAKSDLNDLNEKGDSDDGKQKEPYSVLEAQIEALKKANPSPYFFDKQARPAHLSFL